MIRVPYVVPLEQEAKSLELDNSKTRQAEAVVDRDRIVQETVSKLTKACTTFDLEALNEAMGRAIELGIEGPEVEQAKAMRTRLDEEKELASSLNAAMKVRTCSALCGFGGAVRIRWCASPK